jgi:hypothetical protein
MPPFSSAAMLFETVCRSVAGSSAAAQAAARLRLTVRRFACYIRDGCRGIVPTTPFSVTKAM